MSQFLRSPRLAANISHFSSRSLFTRSHPQSSPLRSKLYATVFALSTGLFAVYYFDARSAIHRYLITPVIRHALDAETGHKLAVKVLKSGLGPRDPLEDDSRLKCKLWDTEISNPIGLAAGFDKDGEAIDGLLNLGFSWVEIGSVTPKPQGGNPRPRVFHLIEDDAIINRYGFPSQGHASVLSRLRARIPAFGTTTESAALRDGAMLAVNLGKNKQSPAESIEDFVAGVRTFGPYADVLVVNVSSPNTPGLRGLQNKDQLEELLKGVRMARDELKPSPIMSKRPRLVLKIAPDLDVVQLQDIAEVVTKHHIDGVIVSNTTTQRPSSLIATNKTETGGLSGAPLKEYSLKALRTLRQQLPSSIPLIGCGGIRTGADALDYAKAGASLVQVYTGFGYDGVGACRRIKNELADELAKEKKTWIQVVNEGVNALSRKAPPIPKTKPSEVTVKQLIDEALELQKLLDHLGTSMGKEEQEMDEVVGTGVVVVT